jgi:hypothetical protein
MASKIWWMSWTWVGCFTVSMLHLWALNWQIGAQN